MYNPRLRGTATPALALPPAIHRERNSCRRLTALVLLCVLLAACDDGPRLSPLLPNARILAFGNSLTFGTGATPGNDYPTTLAELTGLQVINAGVPGELSGDGRARLPGLLARHQPDLVVLIHGGNDTLRGLPAADTRSNLLSMIEASRTAGAQVVMLGVPGRNFTLSAPAYYPDVATTAGVPIDTDALPRLLRDRDMKSDPIHLNDAGYRRLSGAVRDLLRDSGAL